MLPRRGETPQDPREALLACLDTGQSGCLVGRAERGGRFSVYVMLGEVLAAHSEDDDGRMLDLIAAGGHVTTAQHGELAAALAAGDPIADTLFDTLPEDLLLDMLYERFRENLLDFLVSKETEEFQPMEAVFTENIQVGHESRLLIDELVALGAAIAPLRSQPTLVLAPGAAPALDTREADVLARCGSRLRLAELLANTVYEPGRTLEVVHGMLDRGSLVGIAAPPRRSAPAADPAVVLEESASDEPTVEEPLHAIAPAPVGDDDDLAAFQDYDTARGGGSFSTEMDLLDRVDLDGKEEVALVASNETVIEMEEADPVEASGAVSLNFSGPKLHDQEVQRKLGVVNDVLSTIAAAIELRGGPGSGQARLQLLVEGTPVSLAPLFKGVEVNQEGRLPAGQVVKNLRKRPPGEHRRLLNRALSDLMERAMSAADDALEEDELEAMLEQIAGYQQRLGV